MCKPNHTHDVDVYKEQMAELRWRRDQDRHYLTIFFTVWGFSTAAYCAVISKTPLTLAMVAALGTLPVFIWIVGLFCAIKIYQDHDAYRYAARSVIQILKRWQMVVPVTESLFLEEAGDVSSKSTFNELPSGQEEFNFGSGVRALGLGEGWVTSVCLIAIACIAVLLTHCYAVGPLINESARQTEIEQSKAAIESGGSHLPKSK